MKTSTISWNELDEETNSLNCPICNKVWIRDGAEYDPSEVDPCEHLRFRLIDCYDIEWFGGWNREAFERAYAKSYYEVCDDSDIEVDEIILCTIDDFTTEALENMNTNDIDEVLILKEEGLACGSCSMTTLYGIKYDKY